jgi:Tol biopolymer transport system component
MDPGSDDRLSELFERAIEMPPEARAHFLEVCSDDPAVRAELRSLLGAYDRSPNLLERLAAEVMPGALGAVAHGSVPRLEMMGRQLGPYQIVAPLGRGGMGEVYRARDTKLGRDVAIKLLPAQFTADPDRRARFGREARLLATLNHPHIAAIYGLEESGGLTALVLELVEGETLAARLERGPLSPDQVLRIGVQIATALDKAHRAGITHRDLKPANVMLTKSGSATSLPHAKLLDFGLAKKNDALSMEPSTLAAGTRDASLTEQGTIFGTFQYMAPEQLEGQEADARTDIFSFGALLYEMTTGKRAFEGRNRSSVIAAIVSGQPAPLSAVQPLTPPALEHVIRKCLEKDPDDRWQSAHDVAEELRWIGDTGSRAGVAVPTGVRRKTRETIAWAITALALLAVAGIAALTLRDRPESTAYAFTMLPADRGFQNARFASVSPDGKWLCFRAQSGDGKFQLFVRAIDSFASRPLAGSEGANACYWGLDSQSVAFETREKVRVADTVSATTRDLLKTQGFVIGAAMNRDGVILLGGGSGPGLRRVSKDGTTQTITTPDKTRHEEWHGFPVFLRDGQRFLYISVARDPSTREYSHYLYAGSVDSPHSTFLGEIPSQVQVVEPGYLLFVREGTLMYVRFDAKSLAIGGEPARLADGVYYFKPTGQALFSASFDGVLTYRPTVGSSLTWVDKSGQRVGTIGPPGAFQEWIRFSADGSEVVAAVVDWKIGTLDLWMFGTRRQTASRLTSHSGTEVFPVMLPDGRRLFYSSDTNVFVKQLGSADEGKPFWVDSGEQYANDVSPDGQVILMTTDDHKSGTGVDIYMAATDGSGTPAPFVKTPFDERDARFSPDGKTVAYQSNETGSFQIYTNRFPGPNRPRPGAVSTSYSSTEAIRRTK